MPFTINKGRHGYRLYNPKKKQYVQVWFKSKESAARQGINYMRYRGERGKRVGNRIIGQK